MKKTKLKTIEVITRKVKIITPDEASIAVILTLDKENQVSCYLNTNNLPFQTVKAQMEQFVKALQWQIDDERLCPLYKLPNEEDETS